MKNIAILGSTGSIGVNTLNVARHFRNEIKVTTLAAHSNIDLLEKQAKEFNPELIAIYDSLKASELQKRLPNIPILAGMEGLTTAATYENVDFVISSINGTMGLAPTIAAIKAGKDIGLANKESLVSSGALLMSLVKEKKVRLIPIDSEHSAIFQCLTGEKKNEVNRLILTASGGPFYSMSIEQLQNVNLDLALRHPTWNMGPKVTIDSSTLMNKGLEVIEAHWLFDIPVEKIDVVIHPQSIIHSMVEFVDHSIMAQMGEPNMSGPIQYAINYPDRKPGILKQFDFLKNETLQFFTPDRNKFRCLGLAYEAIKIGMSMPCAMNAANEVFVREFIQKKISWMDISQKLDNFMSRHQLQNITSLEDVLAVDAQARLEAETF
jgi:1-deoxy-D-xylulose-5-phosphate reductoisomerase